MPGRHAAPVEERSTRSPETPAPSSSAPQVAEPQIAARQVAGPQAASVAVPEAFTSRRARRDAERLAEARSPRPVVVDRAPRRAERLTVARAAAGDAALRPVATDVLPRAVKQHHPVSIKRMALVLAPVLAITSGIALAAPANADTLPQHFQQVEQQRGQEFRVTSNVDIPVMDDGTTTIVSVPSVVVSGGATAAQAQATLGRALSAGGDRAKLLQVALTYLGDTYVEGGASHQGIDCSGLVMVAYQSVGIQLVHYVPTQDAAATRITEAEALPGDLVVYDNEDHIGLYLGDGLVLQAPHPGEPVDIIPMFPAAHHFARLLPAGA